jgi:hypothetical protein
MAANLSIGISVTFTGDDSGTLTAQLIQPQMDPMKSDQVDITHQGTANQIRDFMSGLADGQSLTLDLLFDSDNVRPARGEAGDLVITFSNVGMTLNTLTIPCNVEEVGGFSGSLGDKMTETVKFKVTGLPVWSTAT